MANYYANVSWKILDALGADASVDDLVLAIPEAVTLTQLAAKMSDAGNALDDVTDGQIIGLTVKIDMFPALDSIKEAPVAGSEIERTGLTTYDHATIPASYSTRIPALAESVIVAGKINQADAHYAIWRDLPFEADAHGMQYVTKARNVFVSALHAMIKFRKYRRQEDRKSYDVE